MHNFPLRRVPNRQGGVSVHRDIGSLCSCVPLGDRRYLLINAINRPSICTRARVRLSVSLSLCRRPNPHVLFSLFSSITASAAAAADVACNNGSRSEDALASPRHGTPASLAEQCFKLGAKNSAIRRRRVPPNNEYRREHYAR